MSWLSSIGRSIFGGGGGGGSSAPRPQDIPVKSVVDLTKDTNSDSGMTPQSMAAMKAYMAAGGGGAAQPTSYNSEAALVNNINRYGSPELPMKTAGASLSQLDNQAGGRASPSSLGTGLATRSIGTTRQATATAPASAASTGNTSPWDNPDFRQGVGSQAGSSFGGMMGPVAGSLIARLLSQMGVGGGVNAQDQSWRDLVGGIMDQQQGQYTSGAVAPMRQYLETALSGNDTLPRESYLREQTQGQNVINAQAGRSRENLMSALGSRGLMRSGMMGRGLQGVEESRVGAMGALQSGLAEQSLQAARQSQQAAAGMLPGLIGAESGAMNDLIRSWLATRQLELERQRVGISQQQVDNQEDNSWIDLLGGLL